FLGGRPPAVDLAAEQRLAGVLVDAAARGVLDSAHDVSDGGLAQALVECCLRGDVGAHVELPDGADAFAWLFSESTRRAVVSVPRAHRDELTELCAARGVECARIGTTDVLAGSLAVAGCFRIPLRELRAAATATLRRFE